MQKTAIAMAVLLGLACPGTAWCQAPAQGLTEPQVRSLVTEWGCTNVSRLSMGQAGRWFGECQKGGKTVDVMVDEQGRVSQGASSHVTSAKARALLMANGCSNVSNLTRGPNDTWRGSCQKGGDKINVTVNQQGNISNR